MMTSRERVIRTLVHEGVDRIPRDLWVMPAVERDRPDEVAEMLLRYPPDVEKANWDCFGPPLCERSNQPESATDAWGCAWQTTADGLMGQSGKPPLTSAADIARFRPPEALLDPQRIDAINRLAAGTSRFVIAWTDVRPFERLQLLHGVEATFAGLARGSKDLHRLLKVVHEFHCRQMEFWASSDADGIQFMDDWGGQAAMVIAPAMWREVFKPLYRDYCRIARAHDKFTFFHCDGNVGEIFGDLVEIGVDAINTQFSCIDYVDLARRYGRQVTFWGGIDPVDGGPEADTAPIRQAVDRFRQAIDGGHGGVIAQCPWAAGTPSRHVAAVFSQWQQPVPLQGPHTGLRLFSPQTRSLRRTSH